MPDQRLRVRTATYAIGTDRPRTMATTATATIAVLLSRWPKPLFSTVL